MKTPKTSAYELQIEATRYDITAPAYVVILAQQQLLPERYQFDCIAQVFSSVECVSVNGGACLLVVTVQIRL